MQQYCHVCKELLGKGGDTYFRPDGKTKVTNINSYISYDLDVDGQVAHFQVESECGSCQTLHLYQIDYVIE